MRASIGAGCKVCRKQLEFTDIRQQIAELQRVNQNQAADIRLLTARLKKGKLT
jgi:hypothetical protein